MEQMDYQYGEILHQNGWKLYTSSIIQKENMILWEIITLNLEVKRDTSSIVLWWDICIYDKI